MTAELFTATVRVAVFLAILLLGVFILIKVIRKEPTDDKGSLTGLLLIIFSIVCFVAGFLGVIQYGLSGDDCFIAELSKLLFKE
jgi:uncharacterized protein YneF (UPF0154 family)